MEPDYFIYQYLQIEHANGVSYIKLRCIEKNYCNCISDTHFDNHDKKSDDSDDSELDDSSFTVKHKIQCLQNQMKYLLLKPRAPILIYENNQFINVHFKNKYEKIIKDKINETEPSPIFIEYRDTGNFKCFESIKKITKIECRYDPWLRDNWL